MIAALGNGCARLSDDPAGGAVGKPLPRTAPPAGAQSSDAAQSPSSLLHKPAPDFALKRVGGGRLALSSLRGKVVLLNFWEPRCPHCNVEAPHLAQWQRQYQNAGLRVVGVTPLASLSEIRSFMQRHKIGYDILVDPSQKVIASYRFESYPLSVLLDRQGMVRLVHQGFQAGDEKKLDVALQKLLKP